MRTRIAAAMTALALLLFPLGAWSIVRRGFDLAMERERTRALSEEAAIARAVAMEIESANWQALYAVASGLQGRYGSPALSVVLVYRGSMMAGAQVPEAEGLSALLETEGRATLLSGEHQMLYIAHRLEDDLLLLLASDVSQVYGLRRSLALWAGTLCLAGVLLSGVLSVAVSGWLARPYKLLAQQRQELIDALAHEMRTPLTAILGGVRLIQRAKLPAQRQDELLGTMAREAQRLSDMDERLLQLTRLEHDAPSFAAFSSMEMAKEALAVFEDVVLTGEDAPFYGERELTIQLLRNLVVNAQRAGGDVPVRVELYPDGFAVTDHGCGMTREQIARAFEPFYKADKSRTRAAGGAGLGLTLCLKIARLHGGTLNMQSEPGKGTRVCYKFDTTS
ncbi:MAG: HAMP domain-containing sensor histidine kinase [Christensenellales bacterium]|nr:HAMP domain-containing sensor histidine kinase [Christensenellales bacterium]